MAIFIYGTKVFTKAMGYYGPAEECPNCHKVYSKSFVRAKTWAHLDYVPLFPVKTRFFQECPICGLGQEMKSKEAKAQMLSLGAAQGQSLSFFARHLVKNKPKGLLATDNTYELWVKDEVTGQELCLGTQLTKDDIKRRKKNRAIKNLPIFDVKD